MMEPPSVLYPPSSPHMAHTWMLGLSWELHQLPLWWECEKWVKHRAEVLERLPVATF